MRIVEAGTTTPAKRYDLGLCLSGGGYRALLYHGGVLARLNEAGLLSKLDMISSVSGGSIAAGLLARHWAELFPNGEAVSRCFNEVYLDRVIAFSQRFNDLPGILKGLANPLAGVAETMAATYERQLFGGTLITGLPDEPWFVFCASNLSTGSLFRMSNRYVADYRIGYAPHTPLKLAAAVSASAGFPPFLSPLRLDLRGFGWLGGKLDETVGQKVAPTRAVLSDGGVYDNHGIEPALKRCRWLLVSDAGAPWRGSSSGFRNWFSQLRRVMDTTDNQVRSLRRRDLINRFVLAEKAAAAGKAGTDDPLLVRGAYWSIAPSARVLGNSPHLATFLAGCDTAPATLRTGLSFLGTRETEQLVNWGYLTCDAALARHFEPKPSPGAGPPIESGRVVPGLWARFSNSLMKVVCRLM